MKKAAALAMIVFSMTIFNILPSYGDYAGISVQAADNAVGVSPEVAAQYIFLNPGLGYDHFQKDFRLDNFSAFLRVNLGFPGMAGVYWKWSWGIANFGYQNQNFNGQLNKNSFGIYFRLSEKWWANVESTKWNGLDFVNFRTQGIGLQYQF